MKLSEKLARLSAPVNRSREARADPTGGGEDSARPSHVFLPPMDGLERVVVEVDDVWAPSSNERSTVMQALGARSSGVTERVESLRRATELSGATGWSELVEVVCARDVALPPSGSAARAGSEELFAAASRHGGEVAREARALGQDASARTSACEPPVARAARISQLRAMIGDVLARGRARAPQSSEPDGMLHARARGAGAGVSARTTARTDKARRDLASAIEAAQRASEALGWLEVEAAPGANLDPGASSEGATAPDPAPRLTMLREAIDGWAPARARLPRVFAQQPWATRETPHGPLFLVERWLEPAHLHGRASVHSALERLPATLAALALDSELAGLDLSRMLFLDTETTGLAGGSGTVAFLVGVAAFHDDSLLLTQLVLPNLGGEVPMLIALAEHLAAASCILTYNGKSFDWPLLRTRYVMNRLPVPPLPPHVDLLHACRRIWKPRLGSVRLQDVEREIMHFSREGDVDGAEIPSRYFSFLRDGGTEWLVPVLEHNQNDLIALPAMLGALGERFERIECGDHALDALAFGRLALRVADSDRAAAFAHVAITASEGSDLESHAWSFRGEVAKRAREAAEAVQHYEQALQLCVDPLRSATLRVLLSKLYEHGLRDLRAAYRHARATALAEGPELQGRRLGRLTRKLEREADKREAHVGRLGRAKRRGGASVRSMEVPANPEAGARR